MNTDDMLCVGCTGPIVLSSTIGRNAHLISGDVLSSIIQGAQEVAQELTDLGMQTVISGGETADVGDIVRTIDVGYTATARIAISDVVDIQIHPGDVIVGLASEGQATYESRYNSGIGSNGLTSARHDVLNKYYANQYPETIAPQTDQAYIYSGNYLLNDKYHHNDEHYAVHELLLSPTRTYTPVLLEVLKRHKSDLHGIIHNTGGGQSKVLKFCKNVTIVKNNLFPIPPVFQMIHEESNARWEEMYQVFNMGHRMEIYTSKEAADDIIQIARSYGIDAKIIGHVAEASNIGMRLVTPDDVTLSFT